MMIKYTLEYMWVIYRPPTAGLYKTFLTELEELIGDIHTSRGVPLVAVDINARVPTNSDSSNRLLLLESANRSEHVTFPTHH